MPVYPARVCVLCNLQTIMVCVHLQIIHIIMPVII